MKKKLLPIISHDEAIKKEEEKKIDFETCPHCGGSMRMKLVQDRPDNTVYSSVYHRPRYDSVQFICGFCRSTSPVIGLTPDIIDTEKVKKRIIKECIEYDCDEDEEEESND